MAGLLFTDATRPVVGAQRIDALAAAHPIVVGANIGSSVEVADLGRRSVALLLDVLLAAIIIGTAAMGALALFSWIGWPHLGLAIAYLLGYLGPVAYFLFIEMLLAGRTPGKRSMGLRVVSLDGSPITARQGALRSLTRLGEFVAQSWILAVFDRLHRRLGDHVAGTLVVRAPTSEPPPPTAIVPPYLSLPFRSFVLRADEMARLSAADFVSLEDFGTRIRHVPPEVQPRLAAATAIALATKMRYSGPVPAQLSERFIFEVHSALKEQLRQLYPDLY